ncbi:MAG: DNA polymerase beta superfamily protein [Actinomycetes bacterium]
MHYMRDLAVPLSTRHRWAHGGLPVGLSANDISCSCAIGAPSTSFMASAAVTECGERRPGLANCFCQDRHVGTVPTMSDVPNVEYGDRAVALPNEILRSVVGSGVHGIAIEGTDDHDEMGVYIEPPEWVLGVERHREDYIWRTQPEGVRSGHGDIDLVLYSLRKYLRLAIKGNPTVLLPLFASQESLVVVTPLGKELRELRAAFLSRRAVERFLGYMRSQHERMLGQSRRNVPNRPELIVKCGWDVKYGSHALRLAHQGFEIASTGSLTLPMPDRERARVLAVKRGDVARTEVSAEISRLETAVRALLDEDRSPLPRTADLDRVSAWAIDAQRRHWQWT